MKLMRKSGVEPGLALKCTESEGTFPPQTPLYLTFWLKFNFNIDSWPRETAQQLRVLVALAENSVSVPSTHIRPHNHS